MRPLLNSAVLLAVMAGGIFASAAGAAVAPRPGLQALLGTFACETHDGTQTWRFDSVNSPWGAWVRAKTAFSPQNGAPAQSALTFIGFDSSVKRWNIVSLNVGGSYYTRNSTSRHFNGSIWNDGYPADGAKAVIKTSTTGYTFDLETPNSKRSPDQSRTACVRIRR